MMPKPFLTAKVEVVVEEERRNADMLWHVKKQVLHIRSSSIMP